MRMEWAAGTEWAVVVVVVRAVELESGVGMEWAAGMETLMLAVETASAAEVAPAVEMVWDFLMG